MLFKNYFDNLGYDKEKGARLSYGGASIAVLSVWVVTILCQLLIQLILSFFPEARDFLLSNKSFIWIASFAPEYFVALPFSLWIFNKFPKDNFQSYKLGGKNFFDILVSCFPIIYIGNLLGIYLSKLLTGGTAINSVDALANERGIIKFLCLVVLAPITEELIFRKGIIDCVSSYGEKSAIIFSALAFGLFHMNLFQFFYAFGIGLVFGYVYTRTRSIGYTIIMHGIINFLGGVFLPFVAQLVPEDASAMAITSFRYYLVSITGFASIFFMFLGLFTLTRKLRELVFCPRENELQPKRAFKVIYLSPVVILFIAFCVVNMIINLK